MGGDGDDTLIGGLGDDTLVGAQADTLLDGGANADLLQLGASFTTLIDGQIVNIEGITLMAAGLSLNLSNQTEGFTLNGFATGASTIIGGAGADRIIGGSGADSLTGGDGADRLTGGQGADTLTGGTGADSFVFSFVTEVDSITDFTSVSDRILLDKSVMVGIGGVGTLTSDAFWSGVDAVTGHDATDRVIYNSTTGALYYDADGIGGVVAVQIGILDTKPTLLEGDFLIF
jgi:Ca2+-binding RTX toxin-like protein